MAQVGFAPAPDMSEEDTDEGQDVEGEQEESTEEPIDEPEDTPDEDVEPEPERPKGSRAQRRIQQLAARNKELEERSLKQDAEYRRYIDQLQRQHQEREQSLERERVQIERQRFEAEQARLQREEEAGLSDIEKWRRSVINDATGKIEEKLSAREKALEARLEQIEKQRKEEQERFEARQRTEYFQRQAQEASKKAVLSGYLPEDRSKLVEDAGNLVMVWSAAQGKDPSTAAPEVGQLIDRLVAAKIKATTSKSKKSVKSNPPSSLGHKDMTPAEEQVSAIPSLEDIKAAGYASFFDWVEKGEKPVRRGAAKDGRRKH